MRLHGEVIDVTTVAELVEVRSRLEDKPALKIRGAVLTYREAHERSSRFAAALAELGVERGDRVATYAYNSIDHACLWFACAKLAAVWVPLNVSLGTDDLLYTLRDAEPKVIVVDEELLETYELVRGELDLPVEVLLGNADRALELKMLPSAALDDATSMAAVDVAPSDPMAIVYTGGSTGMPKGVLVPHLYYIAAAMRFRDVAHATADDVMYEAGHLFHSGGQQLGVAGPMFCGATGVLTRWFSVTHFWDVVREADASIVHVPGTMLRPILEKTEPTDADRDHRVRVGVGTGTGQVRREVKAAFEDRFGFPLLEVYAQTELGVLLCSARVDDRPPGSSGHSDGWAELRIVDELDRPLPARDVGEIAVRPTEPNTFMIGYVNKPDQLAWSWRNLWHHTGDLGYLDEEGRLYFVGRQAYWIRRRGENVSSFEVERLVTGHPSVAECAAVGVPSELGDEDIKIYVQLGERCEETPEAIVAWCEERVAYYKCPRYVEFVDGLPRTAAKGEIEREKLRALGIGAAWDVTTGEWLQSPSSV
jgi:carnitine-CoA ligase